MPPFFPLHRYFKSFQCLFKCAAMPVPWACIPTVEMAPGSLRPNDSLCGSAGKNRAGESLPLVAAPPFSRGVSSRDPPWTPSHISCLNELVQPGKPPLFTVGDLTPVASPKVSGVCSVSAILFPSPPISARGSSPHHPSPSIPGAMLCGARGPWPRFTNNYSEHNCSVPRSASKRVPELVVWVVASLLPFCHRSLTP